MCVFVGVKEVVLIWNLDNQTSCQCLYMSMTRPHLTQQRFFYNLNVNSYVRMSLEGLRRSLKKVVSVCVNVCIMDIIYNQIYLRYS